MKENRIHMKIRLILFFIIFSCTLNGMENLISGQLTIDSAKALLESPKVPVPLATSTRIGLDLGCGLFAGAAFSALIYFTQQKYYRPKTLYPYAKELALAMVGTILTVEGTTRVGTKTGNCLWLLGTTC